MPSDANQTTIDPLGWQFDHSYSRLTEALFTPQMPVQVANPHLVVFNEQLASSLGLESFESDPARWLEQLSGNKPAPTAKPLAQAYAGHQFGHFAVLGDGRALLMGEHLSPAGARVDIQWKGTGPTPYSRRGDGRATLRSMLREYLISEAMHGLGIPTTRSLAVIATGEPVLRERRHEGAILTRVAASHIRVGTFEYVRHFQSKEVFADFTRYVMERHDPALLAHHQPVLSFLEAVMDRQLSLVLHWMRVGFIHGVMNTDNMSIAGETIDYGPCAWMDQYNPGTVFSSIDTQGRYAYDRQPAIAQWNLAVLASSLLPLIQAETMEAVEAIQSLLSDYAARYRAGWWKMMGQKLGFETLSDEHTGLVTDLLHWMEQQQADFTRTFQLLSKPETQHQGIYATPAFQHWYTQWKEAHMQSGNNSVMIAATLRASNPVYVPRNHLVESILDAAEKHNWRPLQEALAVWQQPYTEQEGKGKYEQAPEQKDEGYQTFCGT